MEYKGIDVSKWNGTIDWKAVAASGVQFAMVRAGIGKAKGGATVDPRFLDNVCGAYENGIRVGVFFYSYAMSAEAAMKEADSLIGILAPVREKITFPVAYDLEETSQEGLGRQECTEMVRMFCETVGGAGYTPILYTNPNWLKNFLNPDDITVPLWLAHIEKKPWGSDYKGEYVMHQYSWVGRVPGISGDVDMNVSKVDFSAREGTGTMNENGWVNAINELVAADRMNSPEVWREVCEGKRMASAVQVQALLSKWAEDRKRYDALADGIREIIQKLETDEP